MTQAADPVFQQEQEHLSATYAKLLELQEATVGQLERIAGQAAADKRSMGEELTVNLASDDDIIETYADFAAMNRIVEAYNISQDINAQKLSDIQLLLRQPYFAKVSLRFKPDEPAQDIYIGNAGISDERCRRIVVDWRSPVAETYYNQSNGPTSYEANGRTIHAELLLRRQFDIEEDRLRACFDTTVAIQDALLLASLTHRWPSGAAPACRLSPPPSRRSRTWWCAMRTCRRCWSAAWRAAGRPRSCCSASRTCSTATATASTRAR